MPEGSQLGVVVIHALVAQLPEGVLQLITAQHELSLGLWAAAQVDVYPIERLLESQQLHSMQLVCHVLLFNFAWNASTDLPKKQAS